MAHLFILFESHALDPSPESQHNEELWATGRSVKHRSSVAAGNFSVFLNDVRFQKFAWVRLLFELKSIDV